MAVGNVDQSHLRRSLKLWHLLIYGIIIVQPTAPMSIYGVISNVAHGHVVMAILVAMVAMLFTAISYGRMARVYPSAGSAYTYVGKTLHPGLGYIVGWSMLMDYMLNPIICAIWCGAAVQNVIPQVPYFIWMTAFAALFTGLNLRGVQVSARVNAWLALGLGVVVVIFLTYAVRYIALVVHPHGLQWLAPLYNRAAFAPSLLFRGTSIAVLTYIGFDGISTLSEEVENPRRNILLATVLTCLIIGVLSAVEVYAAGLAWPFKGVFPDSMVDTAYIHVAQRVGGTALFHLLNVALLIANIGSGTAAQAGAARLLYGMGRANALPSTFFGSVDPKTSIPRNNVLLLGGCTLVGGAFLSFADGAELLNFGALVAFMGVNVSAFVHYKIRRRDKAVWPGAVPLLGFLISAFIWASLGHRAQILGVLWLIIGLVLYWIRRTNAAGDTAVAPEFG
jgi:putrescine importer